MAFSFSRLIISESDSKTCEEALTLAGKLRPVVERRGTASCVGEIYGNKIWLGFTRMGIPAWKCSCIYSSETRTENPCVHAITISLAWDRSRGVLDPTLENIEHITRED
jgi:hypothetical protein